MSNRKGRVPGIKEKGPRRIDPDNPPGRRKGIFTDHTGKDTGGFIVLRYDKRVKTNTYYIVRCKGCNKEYSIHSANMFRYSGCSDCRDKKWDIQSSKKK